MPDVSSSAQRTTRRFFYLAVLIIGYAVAGFGAVLLLDGAIQVASIALDGEVFVSAQSVSQEFVVSVGTAVGGILTFSVGRTLAFYSTKRRNGSPGE